MTVEFIVETFFGYDRPGQFLSESWLIERFGIFERFTYRSLMNQSDRAFRIFVQIGDRNAELIRSFAWPTEIEICEKNGRKQYSEIDTRFISITRIDSDDLFHRDAIAEVKRKFGGAANRKVLCWKSRLVWDRVNGYLLPDHPRVSSPFFTHIFPKSIYRDWARFQKEHFRSHGRDGAGDREAISLDRKKVCVIKHGLNWSVLKRGQSWPVLRTEADFRAHLDNLRIKNPGLQMCRDPEVIAKVLDAFGVDRREIAASMTQVING